MAGAETAGGAAPVFPFRFRVRLGAPASVPDANCGSAAFRSQHIGREGDDVTILEVLTVHDVERRKRRRAELDGNVIDLTLDEDAAMRKAPRAQPIHAVIDLTGADTDIEDAGVEDVATADAAAPAARVAPAAVPPPASEQAAAAAPAAPADSASVPPPSEQAAAAAPAAEAAPPAVVTRLAPEPKMQRIGKQTPLVSREDRATLRRMAAERQAQGPQRWKEICEETDIGKRLGLTTKQLRNVVKVKPQEPASSAPWSDELQQQLLAEVAARGRAWTTIRAEGAGGAFRAFRSEDLRRHYDHPGASRPGYTVGTQRVHGVTLVKGGRYQVCFRYKYVGLRSTLAEAAALWDATARAAGVPESELNALPAAAEGAACEPAPNRKRARYSMSDDGSCVSLRSGHSMTREAFLKVAETLCMQASVQSRVTWGALARQLNLGDLIGKSPAVHACWAALTGMDMKTTMWDYYRGGAGGTKASAAAAAPAPGSGAAPELPAAAAQGAEALERPSSSADGDAALELHAAAAPVA